MDRIILSPKEVECLVKLSNVQKKLPDGCVKSIIIESESSGICSKITATLNNVSIDITDYESW